MLTVNVLKTLLYSIRNQFNLIEHIAKNIHTLSDDDIKLMMGNALQTINGLLSLYGEHKTVLSENYNLKLVIENDDLIISTPLLPHRIICYLVHIELMRQHDPNTYTQYKSLMQRLGLMPQCMGKKQYCQEPVANYSFLELVGALNGQVTKETMAKMNLILGDKKEVTSIRLRPKTRAVLQVYSENLGISVSQIINIMIDGVAEQTL